MYKLKTPPKLSKYGYVIAFIYIVILPVLLGVYNPLKFTPAGCGCSNTLSPAGDLTLTIFDYALFIVGSGIVYAWLAYWRDKSIKSRTRPDGRFARWNTDADYAGFGLPSYTFVCAFICGAYYVIVCLIPAAIIVGVGK